MKRLYIVVRDDLTPGLMLAQACHAAFEYGMTGADDVGDNLVVLTASPGRLLELEAQVCALCLSHESFREPDLGGELTALALSGSAQRLVNDLPLAPQRMRRIDSLELSNLTVP